MKLHCIGCGKECDVPVDRLTTIRVFGCTECAKRDDIIMASTIFRGKKTMEPRMAFEEGIAYPPLGLHENYCGYQVAPAVFSSSVEECNKKCEEQDDRKVNVGCMECGLEGGHKTSCKIGLQIARNQIGDEFTDITSRIIRRDSK